MGITEQSTFQRRWQTISTIWSDNRWLYILSGLLCGVLISPALAQLTDNLNAFVNNLVPEAIGIVFTVLILDRLAENRNREDLKVRLFNELRSPAVGQGTAALAWLKREKWIEPDSLIGADLHRVNWENAFVGNLNLESANLNGAILSKVSNQVTERNGQHVNYPINLRNVSLKHAQLDEAVLIGVDLRDAQLTHANLQNAVLVNTNLEGADLSEANLHNVNLTSAILPDGTPWSSEVNMKRFTHPTHLNFWKAP